MPLNAIFYHKHSPACKARRKISIVTLLQCKYNFYILYILYFLGQVSEGYSRHYPRLQRSVVEIPRK